MADNYPVELQPGEQVIAIYRRHPIYAILQFIGGAILLVIAILLIIALWNDTGIIATIAKIALAVGIVADIFWIIFVRYRYVNDMWMVTNQRLVDSTKKNPFNHQVSSISLARVQDVNISITGIVATTFKFGDVSCQTASTEGNFVFRGVPEPRKLLDQIEDAREALSQGSSRAAQPT